MMLGSVLDLHRTGPLAWRVREAVWQSVQPKVALYSYVESNVEAPVNLSVEALQEEVLWALAWS